MSLAHSVCKYAIRSSNCCRLSWSLNRGIMLRPRVIDCNTCSSVGVRPLGRYSFPYRFFNPGPLLPCEE